MSKRGWVATVGFFYADTAASVAVVAVELGRSQEEEEKKKRQGTFIGTKERKKCTCERTKEEKIVVEGSARGQHFVGLFDQRRDCWRFLIIVVVVPPATSWRCRWVFLRTFLPWTEFSNIDLSTRSESALYPERTAIHLSQKTHKSTIETHPISRKRKWNETS